MAPVGKWLELQACAGLSPAPNISVAFHLFLPVTVFFLKELGPDTASCVCAPRVPTVAARVPSRASLSTVTPGGRWSSGICCQLSSTFFLRGTHVLKALCL